MKLILVGAITILLCAFSSQTIGKETFTLSTQQLEDIGQKIFFNETGGNPNYLVAWNEGEAFASLGIGHFIWFPKGLESPFTETFPALIQHFIDAGVELPDWLLQFEDCPWQTKQAFTLAKNTPEFLSLQQLLANTFSLQIDFIHRRMQRALPIMLNDISDETERAILTRRFNDLAATEIGMYSLIDYVNFKGEGTSPTERYKGKGWGLKQVLLEMEINQNHTNDVKDDTLVVNQAFAESCIEVLTRRINNSPKRDVEMRWLEGWTKRCNTYKG